MIITIASNKGGVGKSSLALGLSEYLATRRGVKRVVLADGDPNYSCRNWADRSAGQHKFEVVGGEEDPGQFTHLVIDTPARTEAADLLPLVNGSDLLLIPSTIGIFSLEATIGTLQGLGLPSEQYAVILTFLPTRGQKREHEARESLAAAGVPVLKAGIKQRVIYQDAAIEGAIFNNMKGTAAKSAWADVMAVGKEVVSGWGK